MQVESCLLDESVGEKEINCIHGVFMLSMLNINLLVFSSSNYCSLTFSFVKKAGTVEDTFFSLNQFSQKGNPNVNHYPKTKSIWCMQYDFLMSSACISS